MRISDWSSDVCSADLIARRTRDDDPITHDFLCPSMLETKNDRFCLLAEPVVLESCFGFVERNLSLAFTGFRPVFAAFRNTRRFTGAAPQIIELRTTNGALADDGNAVDVRRDRKS